MDNILLYYIPDKDEFQCGDMFNGNESLNGLSKLNNFNIMERCSSSIELLEHMINSQPSGIIQIAWSVFMKEFEEDSNVSEERIKDLEKKLKDKSKQLEENALAFEELESQLNEKSDNLIVKERRRFAKILSDLKKQLDEKENELGQLMEFKRDLVDRINAVFRQSKRTKEDLQHENELQKEVIEQLKAALDKSKDEIESECAKCYQEGVEMGRELANIEETGILEEIEILREVQIILENDAKQQQNEIFEDD